MEYAKKLLTINENGQLHAPARVGLISVRIHVINAMTISFLANIAEKSIKNTYDRPTSVWSEIVDCEDRVGA